MLIVAETRLAPHMRFASPRFAIVLALLPAFAGATPNLFDGSPPSASAVSAAGQALVSWTPPTTPADSYNVYGVVDGGLTFLDETSGLEALVDGGYTTYAVTAIHGGDESPPTYVLLTPCLWVDINEPPFVFVGIDCDAFG